MTQQSDDLAIIEHPGEFVADLVRTIIDRIGAHKALDKRVPLELDDDTIVQMGGPRAGVG